MRLESPCSYLLYSPVEKGSCYILCFFQRGALFSLAHSYLFKKFLTQNAQFILRGLIDFQLLLLVFPKGVIRNLECWLSCKKSRISQIPHQNWSIVKSEINLWQSVYSFKYHLNVFTDVDLFEYVLKEEDEGEDLNNDGLSDEGKSFKISSQEANCKKVSYWWGD